MTECYFFMPTHFIMPCQRAISFYLLILLWQRMTFNLLKHTRSIQEAYKKIDSQAAHEVRTSYYCAAHKVWIMCSTQNIAHIQYTKVYSCAACCMSHTCFDWVTWQKLKNTCVFSTYECQFIDVGCTVCASLLWKGIHGPVC